MLICECGILSLYISVENVDIAYMLICGYCCYIYLLGMWIELICLSVEKGKMKGNLDS